MLVDAVPAGLAAAHPFERVSVSGEDLETEVRVVVSELEVLYGFSVQLMQSGLSWRKLCEVHALVALSLGRHKLGTFLQHVFLQSGPNAVVATCHSTTLSGWHLLPA